MAGGHGGARLGAGRKPKDRATAELHGSRQRPGVVRFPAPPGSVPLSPPTPVDPPADLPAKARAVWDREASFALAAGTLTPATADQFALHCRNVVLELKLAKKEPGGPSHRGLIAAVTMGRARFGTAPNGKPVAQPAKPVDEFAEFDVNKGA